MGTDTQFTEDILRLAVHMSFTMVFGLLLSS